MVDASGWRIRLWACELIEPASIMQDLSGSKGVPEVQIILNILCDATGLHKHSIEALIGYLNLMAPLLILLLSRRKSTTFNMLKLQS